MRAYDNMIRMDYIPQRINYIDGVPSYLAGEWSGLKSSKWTGSIKVLEQVRAATFKNPNPALPLLGRRHFTPKRCEEDSFTINKKLIKHSIPNNKKKGVKQFMGLEYSKNKEYKKNKISTPGKMITNFINKDSIIDNNQNIIHIEEKFMPRKKIFGKKYTKVTDEYYINNEMGRKKKLLLNEERRNGMPTIAPGDKIYKNPEWSEKFFQQGGLIVGSTNKINYKKTQKRGNNNFYETLDLNIKTLDDNKLWSNQVKKEDLDFQVNMIKGLDEWEKEVIGNKVNDENTNNLTNNNIKGDNKVNKDNNKSKNTNKK